MHSDPVLIYSFFVQHAHHSYYQTVKLTFVQHWPRHCFVWLAWLVSNIPGVRAKSRSHIRLSPQYQGSLICTERGLGWPDSWGGGSVGVRVDGGSRGLVFPILSGGDLVPPVQVQHVEALLFLMDVEERVRIVGGSPVSSWLAHEGLWPTPACLLSYLCTVPVGGWGAASSRSSPPPWGVLFTLFPNELTTHWKVSVFYVPMSSLFIEWWIC